MASAVFPAPVTSSINASSITATAANTLYEGRVTLTPAIYTITCVNTTIATIEFYSSADTYISNAVTVSGTVTINLASAADRVRLWTDTGSNVVVTITKVASALTDVFSGTLDTITSSGTYTGTSTSGFGYALVVGGGGAGINHTSGGNQGGGGGGSGGVGGKVVALTGSMAVTVGTGGTGGNGGGGAGLASVFAGITANGGAGGSGTTGGTGGTVTGATISYTANGTNGSESFGPRAGNGGMATNPYPFIVNPLGVAGIGRNSNPSTATVAPTGNGAGSGGTDSGGTGGYPANGRPGVVYVLRF